MKYRALVAGANESVIDDLFEKMENLEVMTTSIRSQDIVIHNKYFKPNVFLYCLYHMAPDQFGELEKLKPYLSEQNIPFLLIGSKEECNVFERMVYGVADMSIAQPFTPEFLQANIIEFLKRKDISPKAANNSGSDGLSLEFDDPMTSAMPRKHILVIDDSPIMLKTIKEHIQDEYDVATAVNGKVALGFLRRKKTDLILLDYEMPDENGLEVLKKLRSNSLTKDIPVVFLTGVSDRGKIREALVHKPQGYLLKPIDHEKLKDTIEKLIGV